MRLQEKAAFLAYHRRGAEWVSPSSAGAIFEAAELDGRDRAAMELDIIPYHASFVWQRRCRELAVTSEGMREAAYQSGQSSSLERVGQRVGLSKAEVLRICRVRHRQETARTNPVVVLKRDDIEASASRAETDKDALLATSLRDDMAQNIDAILAELWRERRWRFGTLTQKELQKSLAKRSDCGYIFMTLSLLSPETLSACFGWQGLQFLLACAWTFEDRQRRKREYLDENGYGLKETEGEANRSINLGCPIGSFWTCRRFRQWSQLAF